MALGLHMSTPPPQGAPRPLELAAAKSRAGHAEAGAGLLGVAAAVARLQGAKTAPLLHLRSLNPHLAGLLV
jgi:acyl transferase domain-containing protein